MTSYSVLAEKVSWTPFTYSAKKIEINLKDLLPEGESIDINIKYNGVIDRKEVNRISGDWVELGLYAVWFPVTEKLDKALFKVKVLIDQDYRVIGQSVTGEENGRSIIEQTTPSNDCIIIASNKLKNIKNVSFDQGMSVFYIDEKHKDVAEKINKYSAWLIDYYLNQFGNIPKKRSKLILLPRLKWGGYSRPGLLVLSANICMQPELLLFKYLAHEIGHFWWLKADVTNWEDWLNESFAEYSGLLAVRQQYGEEEFKKIIEKYKKAIKGLPPIKGIDRGDEKAYSVLYQKGPVLLEQLENIIGRDKFIELLKKIHHEKVNTTERFLDILSKNTTENIGSQFDKLLSK